MINNVAKSDLPATSLSILHNYFDSLNIKIIFRLYIAIFRYFNKIVFSNQSSLIDYFI